MGPERLRCFFVQERQRVVEGLGHRCGVRLLEVPRKRISQIPKVQRLNHCVLGGVGVYSSAPPVDFLPWPPYRDKQRYLVSQSRLDRLALRNPCLSNQERSPGSYGSHDGTYHLTRYRWLAPLGHFFVDSNGLPD